MKTWNSGLAMSLVVASLACHEAQAAKFEPLVVAGKPQGQCTALLPGKSEPVKVELGKAYPYGSVLVSGEGSSLPLVFSTANECTLSGQCRVVTAQSDQDPKQKLLTLENGRLDVALDPAYQEANSLDVASHCVRASFIKGGKASFESAVIENDLQLLVLTCGDANLKLSGPQFSVPMLDKDDILSVACAPDLSYIRVKVVKGEFDVNIRDAEGNPLTVPVQAGWELKISQKRSEVENNVLVTILVVGADESMKQAISYTVKTDATSPATVAAATTDKTPKKEGAAAPKAGEPKQPGKEGEWTPMWASTSTASTIASTTTTTTVPRIDAAAAEAYRRSRGLIVQAPNNITPTGRT
jgi:hypothetical protein